jgi:fibronectin type III domain protein
LAGSGTAVAITFRINHNLHNLPVFMKIFLRGSIGLLVYCVLHTVNAQSPQSVTLSWNPNPESDIAGYHVSYGTTSGSYTQQIDAGSATTASVSGLQDGTRHFFVVTAYDTAGLESLPSTEVAYPPLPNLVNVSTRGFVQTGDKVMIGGFIITGDKPKKVVLRALGPSLAQAGVSGAMADPILELHDSAGAVITSNDNWDPHDQNLIAAGFAPPDQHDSAFVITLPAGSYTAIVRGANGSSGVALFELYDLDPSSSRIANLSTRADVEQGDNVMIAGIIIPGTQPMNVLVRVVGPSLTSYGVSGALQNPTIDLNDGNGSLIFQNTEWRTAQEQQLSQSGLAPTDDRESAIIATLQPGNYTAVVRGVAQTGGVALVEVYNLE